MKKIFTLIAVAALALTANAQRITFGADDVAAAGTLNGKTFSKDGLVLTIKDGEGKFAIDANSAWFGDASAQENFTHRLKTGGKSQTNEGKERWITLTIPEDGKLSIYARTGSSSTERGIEVVQNGTKVLNFKVLDANAVSVDLEAAITAENPTGTTKVHPIYNGTVKAGTAEIDFPDGAVNFYCIELAPGETGDDPGTGGDQPGGDTPTPGSSIDYPNSTDGITISGTTSWDSGQKYHGNADTPKNISFANGYTSDGVINDNWAEMSIEGGFKTGDVVTVAGYFNNSDDTKQAAVTLFTGAKGETPVDLWTSGLFINGRNVATDPTPESYTLEADAATLKLGRANGLTGATRTNVTLLKVTRGGTGISEMLNIKVDGAIYNMAGQKVGKDYKGIVISNGRKMIQK